MAPTFLNDKTPKQTIEWEEVTIARTYPAFLPETQDSQPQIGYCETHQTQYISDTCVFCRKDGEKANV